MFTRCLTFLASLRPRTFSVITCRAALGDFLPLDDDDVDDVVDDDEVDSGVGCSWDDDPHDPRDVWPESIKASSTWNENGPGFISTSPHSFRSSSLVHPPMLEVSGSRVEGTSWIAMGL